MIKPPQIKGAIVPLLLIYKLLVYSEYLCDNICKITYARLIQCMEKLNCMKYFHGCETCVF